MQRRNVFDGTEVTGGYVRAVRVGPHIHVSGTTSLDKNGNVVGKDVYEQTRETYRKIATALEKCGAGVKDNVRVTSYIVDMKQLPGFPTRPSRSDGRQHAGLVADRHQRAP